MLSILTKTSLQLNFIYINQLIEKASLVFVKNSKKIYKNGKL